MSPPSSDKTLEDLVFFALDRVTRLTPKDVQDLPPGSLYFWGASGRDLVEATR